VRYGDDLSQLANWFGVRRGLDDGEMRSLKEELDRLTPEAQSPKWIAQRASRDTEAAANRRRSDVVPSRDVRRCFPADGPGGGCLVTIALTTCKRLKHFQATMRGLIRALDDALFRVACRVIVVDDSSSQEDRAEMAAEFPEIDFLLKSPRSRGHAHSMNLLLRLVETRYLLYLEDDWLALPGANAMDVVFDAIAIMRHAARQGEPLAQVLLNDQSSRGCAYAVSEHCGADVLGTAGWPRHTSGGVKYRLHEFGTLEPAHVFTYWPGFTLNPAVWDLDSIRCTFNEALGRPPVFSASDARFEQSFSLAFHDSGLRVAYLPRMTFAHTGAEESAYGLNNFSRPWDDPAR